MDSCAAPMWTVLDADPKLERGFKESFRAQSADPKKEKCSSHISRQVMSASASCCAGVQFIEVEHSEKSFAAPKLVYRDGADLLSEIREIAVDSGSTLSLTSSPLNCRECVPVNFKINWQRRKLQWTLNINVSRHIM